MTDRAFIKLVVLLAIIVAIVGPASMPREDDGIRAYTVARPEPKNRLIGAIIPQGNQAWFFKLTGPNHAVADHAAAFRELVKSVSFSADAKAEPTWKLPEGWVQRPGSQMRFATLQVESGSETLDCSVTVLPMSDPNLSGYLLANINRWRDQLRVPKISASELDSSTSQVKLSSGDLNATIVEFTGEMAAAPMAPSAIPNTTSSRPPMPGAKAEDTPQLKFEVPPGWTPGALDVSRGGITVRRAAAFEVRDGEQRAEVTVTKLPATAMLANVNRWRGQIGLESITSQQFDKAKQQLEFAGQPADYVQFVGEKEAILGVIAVQGRDAWFVKLQGTVELATREKQRFEAFVKSVRFP